MSGVYRCFCHRVPHRIHILPCKIHIFHLCFASGNTCPEGFATDATSLQQPPRSAAKRRCGGAASFTDALENHSSYAKTRHEFPRFPWDILRTMILHVCMPFLHVCVVSRTGSIEFRWGGLLWLLAEDWRCRTFAGRSRSNLLDQYKIVEKCINFMQFLWWHDVSWCILYPIQTQFLCNVDLCWVDANKLLS